jgi:hypothetical protein
MANALVLAYLGALVAAGWGYPALLFYRRLRPVKGSDHVA